MGIVDRRDLVRQVANVVGAVFQVGATAALSVGIQSQVNRGTPLIEPALYAFFIWGVIFTLSLVYAVYQALPRNRENPALQRCGPFTAVAFFCTGLWSFFTPAGLTLPALGVLFIALVCLVAAYLRLARLGRERGPVASGVARIAAPMLGIFAGWLTAANIVSASSEAVRFGLVEGGSTGEALLGSGLLLLGSLIAAGIVLAGRGGPVPGYLVYGLTILWALVGIVVQQYDASLLTTATAVVAAAPVVLALLGNRRRSDEHEGTQSVRPRVV